MKNRKSWFSKLTLTNKIRLGMTWLAMEVLLIVLAGVTAQMVVMLRSQKSTYDHIYENSVSADELAMLGQAEKSLQSIVQVQVEATNRVFRTISGIEDTFADKVQDIYDNPEFYPIGTVQPLAESAEGTYSANYYAIDGETLTEELEAELGRLSNLRSMQVDYVKYIDAIGDMYVGTESGLFYIYTDSGNFDTDGYVPRNQIWYRNAAQNPGDVVWTETYIDAYGNVCITASKAITDADGAVTAVAAIDIRFDDVLDQILAVGLGDSGKNFMLSKDGRLIAYEGMDAENFNGSTSAYFEDTAELYKAIKAGDGQAFFAVLDGQEVYISLGEEPETGWLFCAAVYTDEILSSIQQLENNTRALVDETAESANRRMHRYVLYDILGAILIAVLALLQARGLAHAVTGPIKALARSVSGIGAGDFQKRFEVTTRDEIGALTASINRMQGNQEMFVESFRKVIAENARISSELNVATQIQADMLPRIFPPFPEKEEIDLYATMDPAKEVGGDFYDFFLVDDDHLALVMADVSGKGVPAALFMVISKTLIKNRTLLGGTPAEILTDVNNQLCEGNEAEMFVTAWLGILELPTGKVTASNAGHEYPAIRDGNGNFTLLKDKHGMMMAAMSGVKYTDYEFALEKGGGFFVYTDGVPESTDAENTLYGTDRMVSALNIHRGAAPNVFMQDVSDSIEAFVKGAPQFDDTTMLGLVWKGSREGR